MSLSGKKTVQIVTGTLAGAERTPISVRELRKRLKGEDQLILVDEMLWRDDREHDYLKVLRKQAAKGKLELLLTVLLKPQYEYLDDCYRAEVSEGYSRDSWSVFFENKNAWTERFGLHYAKRLEKLEAEFGQEKITIVTGDEKLPSPALPAGCERPAKEKLNCDQIEMLRIVNALYDSKDRKGKAVYRELKCRMKETAAGAPGEEKQLFCSEEERRAIRAAFEEENRAVAGRYLRRETLFEEPKAPERTWEYDPVSMQENMILFLAGSARKLYEGIRAVQSEDKEISIYTLGNRWNRFRGRQKAPEKEEEL